MLAALEHEAERLAKLSEYERALQLQRSARQLDVPVATLERRVAACRGDAVAVDRVQLGRRLAKLVYMLGSPETAGAAADAIGRALQEAGRGWSYLAGLVAEAEPGAVEAGEGVADSWIRACEALLKVGSLGEREREFVTDMALRFTNDRWFEPTEKQEKWFAAIYRKYLR